jgi:hypothetical protein
MPIGGMRGGQSPLDALPVQPVLHVLVICDVILVVIMNEAVMERRPKYDHHRQAQQQANDPFLPSACRICHRLNRSGNAAKTEPPISAKGQGGWQALKPPLFMGFMCSFAALHSANFKKIPRIVDYLVELITVAIWAV